MFSTALYSKYGLKEIYEKIMAGERLSKEDGLRLFSCNNINAIGSLADHVRQKLHGSKVTYVVNRQINYTNICVNGCLFCAFRRDHANQQGAYTLTKEKILQKIASAHKNFPLDEMHMVGGCHPDLKLAWFEDLLSSIRALYPNLPLKAFTPVEILHFARMEKISPENVLMRLQNSGLEMMPGGGAEIFDETLRAQLCPQKATAAEWLAISGAAHKLGIKTNCTMLFGHLETYEQRVDHLCRLREQQDKTHGFTCFIPLPFLKRNSRLKLPEKRMRPIDGIDQLKTIAVSRLMLDNIPHIKAYWIMLGIKLAQTALCYGANDLDGTIVEERIGHMAGATSSQALTIGELEDMIRQAGFTPCRRNATFENISHSSENAL